MNRVQSCRCWKGNPSHAEICFIIVVVLLYQSVLFCFFCVLLSLSASSPPFSLTLSCVCGCGSSSRVAHLSLIDSSPSGFITLLSPPISAAVSCPPPRCMSKCRWARCWTPTLHDQLVPCMAASTISVRMCVWMGESDRCCKVLRAVSRLEKGFRNASYVPYGGTQWRSLCFTDYLSVSCFSDFFFFLSNPACLPACPPAYLPAWFTITHFSRGIVIAK